MEPGGQVWGEAVVFQYARQTFIIKSREASKCKIFVYIYCITLEFDKHLLLAELVPVLFQSDMTIETISLMTSSLYDILPSNTL